MTLRLADRWQGEVGPEGFPTWNDLWDECEELERFRNQVEELEAMKEELERFRGRVMDLLDDLSSFGYEDVSELISDSGVRYM